jgi:hypothetical protein
MAGDTGRIGWSVPNRANQLTAEQQQSILPRVHRLRADPDTIAMGLGDSVFMPQHVRILAMDADGVVLGEIRRYDFGMSRLAPLRSGALRSLSLGTGTFTARWPRRLLAENQAAPAPAEVTVLVTARSGIVLPPIDTAPGTAVLTVVVRNQAGEPITDALVQVYRGSTMVGATRASADGTYRVEQLPTGIARVVVRALGFVLRIREAEVTAGSERQLDVTMQPIGPLPELDPARRPE